MEVKKRYTVLTYIFNHYEKVHEVREKDPEADYLLITDDPKLKSETWRVVYDPMLDLYSPFGKCYDVRFHPFRYAKTPIVVRIDGSVEVRQSLKPIVDEFERGKYDRCVMIHPHRNMMRDEYDVWIKTRHYPKEQATRCMKAMERMGYNLNQRGLIQACFEVVRNTAVNHDLNDMTFGLLALMGNGRIERLDQTVTSFVLQRFFPKMKLMCVSESIITDGGLMQWYIHNSDRPIPLKADEVQPYLFGKPVTTFQPIRKGK